MYKNYYTKIISLLILIVSMQSSELSIAQELINQTELISVNMKKRSDLTTALLLENYQTVKTLIDEGAHIDESDKNMVAGPFLVWSIEKKECGFIRLLDEIHAVDLSRVFSDGTTALHSTVQYQAPNVLRYLLGQKKVDLNQQRRWGLLNDGNIGFTALHYAAKQQDTQIVQLLIDAGADVTIKDQHGKIAYDYAVSPEMMRLFKSKEEDILEKIEPEFANKEEIIELIYDFKKAFTENSYPFLEESFAAFNLDFKAFVLELLDNKEITDSIFNNHIDDLPSAFHDFIGKAEVKLAQELAVKLNIESPVSFIEKISALLFGSPFDKVIQDPVVKSVIGNVHILDLALRENKDELLIKVLKDFVSNKTLKSLFVDTNLMYHLPVLYHSTNHITLNFLVEHGAGEKESPISFHKYTYAEKLKMYNFNMNYTFDLNKNPDLNRLTTMINVYLDNVLRHRIMLTFGLVSSVRNQYFKQRKMDAIIIEAKHKNKKEVLSYLRERYLTVRFVNIVSFLFSVGAIILIFYSIILEMKKDRTDHFYPLCMMSAGLTLRWIVII